MRQWINRTEQDLGIHFLGNQTDGGNCFIYDYTRMSDPWHNVKVAFIFNAMPVTNLVNLQLHDAKK